MDLEMIKILIFIAIQIFHQIFLINHSQKS